MTVIFNKFLIEALALALAASQIFVDKGIRQSFNIEHDKAEVMQIMRGGCEIIRGEIFELAPAFKLINPIQFLDKQIARSEQSNLSTVVFRGLRLQDLKAAYQIFCLGEVPPNAQALLEEVIFFYNSTLQELPSFEWLKDYKLATYSSIRDQKGTHVVDVFRQSRRRPLPLAQIPDKVKLAFLAAEDQNFYDLSVHRGIDRRGLARAGFSALTGSGGKRTVGGSTITQQLVKNLLLSPESTYERKLREMVLAYHLEKQMTKDQILELYLNYVYFGRQSWGVEMAAKSWFGLTLEQLSNAQIAFLAGLPKGPRLLNPLVNPDKSRERTEYVLNQMATASVSRPPTATGESQRPSPVITEADKSRALMELNDLTFLDFQLPVPKSGYHFFDELVLNSRKQLNIDPLQENVTITATINMDLQEKVEDVFREGLVDFELSRKRATFSGPEGNLTKKIAHLSVYKSKDGSPHWLTALRSMPAPLSDVRWKLAVVLSPSSAKRPVEVGLDDGRIVQMNSPVATQLKTHDVVYVKVGANGSVELRFRPKVQGAVVVMENSGRIVAMVGGFSYSASPLNRSAHMIRSPGSTAKVATYMAALNAGVQPNTLIEDGSTTLQLPGDKPWSPKGASGRIVTLRNALENSRNLVPVRLLSLMDNSPKKSLGTVLEVMKDCGMVQNPGFHYPAILGGGVDARVVDMAACYSTIANGGLKNPPRYIDRIERDGQTIFLADAPPTSLTTVDRESAFQMRRMLQGVVVRGTAKSLNEELKDLTHGASLEDFIGGKTGTSQDGLDAWFVGFTNNLTIAVWVGYDNESAETRETLGDEITAAKVAVPIWSQILRATTQHYPLVPIDLPPPDLSLVAVQTQLSGQVVNNGVGEFHRLNRSGERMNTRESWYNWPEPPPPTYTPFFYNPSYYPRY